MHEHAGLLCDRICLGLSFYYRVTVAGKIAESSNASKQLHLLTLFPYPDATNPELQPSYDAGLDLLPAARLAAERINNRTDLLHGYQLVLTNADGGCEITSKGLVSFLREVVYPRNERIVGIIGPACSASTQAVSPLIARFDLFNFHIGGSPVLANRRLYPNSFGTLGSATVFIDSLFTLVDVNKWNNMVVFYDQSRLFFYSTFLDMESRILMEVPGSRLYSFVVSDTYIPLAMIKEPAEGVFPRIAVVLTGPELARRIMCLAYHSGQLYPTYQWVIIARELSDFGGVLFRYEGNDYNCSGRDMVEVIMRGNILFNYQLSTQHTHETDSAVDFETYRQQYDAKRTELYNLIGKIPDPVPDVYAPTVYDAVWSMALALNNSNITLEDYHYRGQKAVDNIRMAVHQLTFEGVSGRIQFDPKTGFTSRLVAIDQVFDGIAQPVATSGRDNISFISGSAPVFIDDTFPENPKSVEIPLAVFFYVIFTVELVITGATQVVTIVCRKTPSVKASSVRLNQLIFIGCYLLSLGAFLYVSIKTFPLEDKPLGWVCHVIWAWITPSGYVVIVSVVIARMWRLYRIFIRYHDPGPLISDTALCTLIGILVFIYAIFAIVWTIADPIHVEVVARETVDGRRGQVLEVELDRLCTSNSSVWTGLVFGCAVFLLVVVVILALLTRSIHNPKFSTTSVSVFSYLLFLIFVAGFPTYYTLLYLYVNINIDFAVLCVIWMLTIIFCIVCIIFPPIAPPLREKFTHCLWVLLYQCHPIRCVYTTFSFMFGRRLSIPVYLHPRTNSQVAITSLLVQCTIVLCIKSWSTIYISECNQSQ